MSQAGGEISEYSFSGPDGRSHSDTFDMNPLQWQTTNYSYRNGWNSSQNWIDYPCGSYGTPKCFNGASYSPSYWANNKP